MNDPSIEDWRKDLLLNPKGALLTLKIEDEVDFIELVLSLDAPLNYDNYNGSANNFYGKKHTEEYKAAHSKRFSGKGNPCYGKIVSEETKKKISKANKGNPAPNGKRVTVDGIEYESLKKAMIKTGISLYKLRKILKEIV